MLGSTGLQGLGDSGHHGPLTRLSREDTRQATSQHPVGATRQPEETDPTLHTARSPRGLRRRGGHRVWQHKAVWQGGDTGVEEEAGIVRAGVASLER